MFADVLPRRTAGPVMRSARRTYATQALQRARTFGDRGDSEAARAHVRAAAAAEPLAARAAGSGTHVRRASGRR